MCYTRGQGCGMWHSGKEMSGQRRLLNGSPQVQRVVTDGVTPEQAADEAIVRIKQILSE
jgi:hypothetical protein